jgi:hypothetical protein
VVIYNFYLDSVFSLPTKANAPSVIDPDDVLPCTIANKLLEPASWRGSQIIRALRGIQEQQLSQSSSLNIGRQAPRSLTPKHSLCFTIPKTVYHKNI